MAFDPDSCFLQMDILDRLSEKKTWEELLAYRREHGRLGRAEEKAWRAFIDGEGYRQIPSPEELPLPFRREISKSASGKKRVIYSYPEPFHSILKGAAFLLYSYDGLFCDSCYAFRKGRSAGDALKGFRALCGEGEFWCLKADISDYFNSIDTGILLEKLDFLKENDLRLYRLFEKMLLQDACIGTDGKERQGKRGAMAGIPVAPFFANVYLRDVDLLFAEEKYFRYSDDILLLAEDRERLLKLRDELFAALDALGLGINEKKLHLYAPGEEVEYLGFKLGGGICDLSDATIEKMKGKIRRKAHALRRWCAGKKLPPERGAKGFVRAMNRKLYAAGDREFSWSRWFFPYLSREEGLRELDACLQQYARYCVTGRHYKGNYRIGYPELKAWGYRSLVNEWYKSGKQRGEKAEGAAPISVESEMQKE
ncbi:MAG: reverse transcriptase/maturase family protein [Lachnospiraceae bacterium]|nr:reverse transcriptase/maturase family protein [Lachnospiraceae bacterium]